MTFTKVDRLKAMSSRCHIISWATWLSLITQIAGGSAMAMALCFPSISWIAWASLFPLLISIRSHTPRRAMLSGTAWSVSLLAVMLLFAQPDQSVTFFAGLCGIIAISFYAGMGAWATRHIGFHPLVLGVAWMLVEMALSPLGWQERVMADVYASSGWLSLLSHSLGCVFVGFAVAFITASIVSGAMIVYARVSVPRHRSKAIPTIIQSLCGDRVLQQILELVEADPRAPPDSIHQINRH